jgi:exopolyphosphatase/guanosine-5'-triphosphate,3'-diphosphate pyrophosphatase
MRAATVDIGTNTVLLLVAERRADGVIDAIAERATVTRLGQGVDRSRRFAPDAIARTVACLDDYARVASELGAERVAVVGTSAMRDAEGGDELRRHIRAAFGEDVRVLSGEAEGLLAFRGAVGGLPIDRRGDVAVFDIGGGSTEIVSGRFEGVDAILAYVQSFDIGSVRLSERHVAHDPPLQAERDVWTRVSRDAFSTVPPLPGDASPVGIAGTMTTLAAVSLGLNQYDPARVHGYVMKGSELHGVVDRLAAIDLASRRSAPGMEPKRADVIVAGGHIALALLDHWRAADVVISDRGVRWGLAEELLLAR